MHLPMKGVRVLEVAQWTYVPAAGAVLADWGADVIKIEHPVTGDAQRGILQTGTVKMSGTDVNPFMEHPNRGKRSVGLDIRKEEGRELLYEMARNSDVFLTNFLPEARTKLAIDVDDIRAQNPDIIYVRGSALDLLGNGLNDRGIGVPMDQRCHVVRTIDARNTIEIGQAAALAEVRIGRMWLPQYRVATYASRQHVLGALEEISAARVTCRGVGVRCHINSPISTRSPATVVRRYVLERF